jgi:signal transduction histidine kinase
MYPINWLSVLWGIAGGCLLTLTAASLALATRRQGRVARGHLLFAVMAASAAGIGVFEVLLANARTVDQYASLIRAVHIPVSLLVLSIPWVVRDLLGAGRTWLATLGSAVWCFALVINFLEPHSRIYDPITSIERVTWLGGAEFSLARGRTGPGALIGHAGVFLILLFVADAAVTMWKRRDPRRLFTLGGWLVISLGLALIHSMLVDLGLLRSPYLISVAFTFIMGGMALELVHEALRVPLLEHEVEVRDVEVAQLSRQAMLREISGSVAHELSQPITSILNNAEAAISFLDREPPELEEVRAALRDIAEQDRHASEVVAGLARLIKKDERQSEFIDPAEFVTEALDLAGPDLRQAGIEVSVQLAEEPAIVRGDRVLLCLILLNLVRNAVEAMAETDDTRRRLDVRTEARDGGVEVVVTDSGPGVPAEHGDRVFDPFFTTRPRGSGLGLAVSRTLAEMHGGSLTMERGPHGLGTAMHLLLPASGTGYP